MTKPIEYRLLGGDASEIRSVGDGMSFEGYTSRYLSPSEPLPFTEIVEPGAWSRSLKSRNEIKAFVNHNTDLVIGSTRAGTLRYTDDDSGLMAHIDLPETTYGKDAAISVGRGDASGMSVGMTVVRDEWSKDYTQRRIIEARLHESSIVTGFPAFRSTTAVVRSLPFIAQRSGVDLDTLTDAMAALEAGEVSDDQAAALIEAVERIRPAKAEEPPAPEPDAVPVDVLLQKLDLIAKAI